MKIKSGPEYLYSFFELSTKSWFLGFATYSTQNPRTVKIAAGDFGRLDAEILKAKRRFGLAESAEVVSAYEAGQDGFWIHRALLARGIHNLVLDSSSLPVDRSARRAKTDRLDAISGVRMLVEYSRQGGGRLRIVHVPTCEAEDDRRLDRARKQVQRERIRLANRMVSLLRTQGIEGLKAGPRFPANLDEIRLWNGEELGRELKHELLRDNARVALADEHLRELNGRQRTRTKEGTGRLAETTRKLIQLRGIASTGGSQLSSEFFGTRHFANRRQLGGATGLVPTPYNTGQSERNQGISKRGNKRLRSLLIEYAWGWLRHQPQSDLSQWYERKYAHGGKRMRKIGIVAMARKLALELWRYVEHGVLPEGALLKDKVRI